MIIFSIFVTSFLNGAGKFSNFKREYIQVVVVVVVRSINVCSVVVDVFFSH